MFDVTPPLALRLAQPDDIPFFKQLYATTRDDLKRLPMPQWQFNQMVEMQQRVQENGLQQVYPRATQWTILLDDQRIGRLIVDFTDNDWRVIDIALMPENRLNGYGRQVMEAVMHKARETLGSVSLAVFEFNKIARHLYNNLNFKVITEDPVQAQMIWRSAESPAPIQENDDQ